MKIWNLTKFFQYNNTIDKEELGGGGGGDGMGYSENDDAAC